jgi:glycosyltransferase involved in cell wall biosynthesis
MTTVLMTADTVGGVWTYALELADALAPHGVDVVLATMGRAMSDAQRAQLRASAVVEVRESGYALEWMDEPWADVDRAAGWLLGLEDEVGPDIVHLNGYAHAALPWRVPTVVVAHSCVLSWWRAVHGDDAPRDWEEYRRRVANGLGSTRAVVAPTAAMLSSLEDLYGPMRHGVVVPNGRRHDWFVDRPKEPLVLSAGRLWDEAKNVAALDAVADQLDWQVAIAGDGERPGGTDRFDAAGAQLLGSLPFDELAGWLARASVFALPARYEPFGLAALEAGLAGCALVLGDIPSLREVWGDAAVFVDPDDGAGLVQALRAMERDACHRKAMAARAAQRARAYGVERMAAGYLGVYRSVAGRTEAQRVAS